MKKETLLGNLPLLLGIALPILFVISISLAIYLPTLSIKPAHDFLYTQDSRSGYSYNGYQNEYHIESGKVTLVPSEARTLGANESPRPSAPRLYYYNTSTNAAREISYEEAQALSVISGPTSPDGYLVEYRYNSSGIFDLFGGNGDGSGYYVTKGGAGKKLPALSAGTDSYRGNVAIIGWIK
ncbi:MAG: hypothetical protein ABIT47_03655 [Candidatus Paceibacterota bacterium]